MYVCDYPVVDLSQELPRASIKKIIGEVLTLGVLMLGRDTPVVDLRNRAACMVLTPVERSWKQYPTPQKSANLP